MSKVRVVQDSEGYTWPVWPLGLIVWGVDVEVAAEEAGVSGFGMVGFLRHWGFLCDVGRFFIGVTRPWAGRIHVTIQDNEETHD